MDHITGEEISRNFLANVGSSQQSETQTIPTCNPRKLTKLLGLNHGQKWGNLEEEIEKWRKDSRLEEKTRIDRSKRGNRVWNRGRGLISEGLSTCARVFI